MNQTCESCGLPIRDGERLSLFQTHHEPFAICIRRLRAEVHRMRKMMKDSQFVTGFDDPCCPWCHESIIDGHSKDCQLVSVLEETYHVED